MSQKGKADGAVKSVHPLVAAARKRDVWIGLLLLRIANALTISTFFQPDEFYQSLEPAWHLAFGKGDHRWQRGAYNGPWVTWEYQYGVRSSLYPFLYAGVYKVIDTIAVAMFPPVIQTKLLIYGPKLIQGFGAALMDYFTWALAGRVYGENSLESSAVLALAVTSPWQFFVSTRSLSNSFETTLTVMALYFWPWESLKTTPSRDGLIKDAANLKYSLVLAALATLVRPNNILIWITLAASAMFSNRRTVLTLLTTGFFWGSMVLLLGFISDLFFYGQMTFPPANFYKYNITQGLAAFYGENRIDYYFTEGIPFLLTLSLPFAITGMSQALSGRYLALPADTRGGIIHSNILRSLAIAALALPLGLSVIAHKEARFIYPIFPMLLIIISRPVIAFFHPFPNPSGSRKLLFNAFFVGNVLLSIYLGYFHNSGAMAAINFLRSEHERHNPGLVKHGQIEGINVTTAAIFMPCHSTPWRSHLVYSEINIWALTCDPPVNKNEAEKENYEDESDQFYEEPVEWMKREFAQQKRTWPTYVVMYEHLISDFKEMVSRNSFEEAFRSRGSLFYDDWRKTGPVYVFVKTLSYGGPGREHDPLPADAPDPDQDSMVAALEHGMGAGKDMGLDAEYVKEKLKNDKRGKKGEKVDGKPRQQKVDR